MRHVQNASFWNFATLVCCVSALAFIPGDAEPQGPPPAKGMSGRPPSVTFGKPEIVRPRSASGRDLSDHYGLSVEVTYAFQPDADLASSGQPSPRVVKTLTFFTYNIAQVPGVLYGGSRAAAENMEDIARHLNDAAYDVVFLQEAFLSAEALEIPGGDLRERLRRAVSGRYPYQALGPKGGIAQWDSGLLILSRFPILERHTHEYEDGVGIPDNYVNKGILHARIQIGTERYQSIDVFTTHTQSGDDNDDKVTRGGQFVEARRFIDRHRGTLEWVLAGDLNVPGVLQTPNYDAIALPQRERVYTEQQDEYSRMMATLGKPRDLWTEFSTVACTPNDRLPCDRGYTASVRGNDFRGEPYARGNRLDYFLVETRQLSGQARPPR